MDNYRIETTAAMQAADRLLSIEIASSNAAVEDALRVRHQVYAMERGYEQQDARGIETDSYDVHSMHVLLRIRGCNTPIGASRLILPRPGNNSFPMQDVCDISTIGSVPLSTCGEVSRLSLIRTRGHLPPEAFVFSRLMLYRGLLAVTRASGTTHWVAVMEKVLIRLLAGAAINFKPFGPPVEYHGLRQPVWSDVEGVLSVMRKEQPATWAFVNGYDAPLTKFN